MPSLIYLTNKKSMEAGKCVFDTQKVFAAGTTTAISFDWASPAPNPAFLKKNTIEKEEQVYPS